MSAASMWTAMQAAIAAVTPYQGSDPVASAAYRAAVGQAMCTAIISEQNSPVAWDGTNDRILDVGQFTSDSFTSATSMPLHIACGDGQIYEIDLNGTYTVAAGISDCSLKMNNAAPPANFNVFALIQNNSTTLGQDYQNIVLSGFEFTNFGASVYTAHITAYTTTTNKSTRAFYTNAVTGQYNSGMKNVISLDTTTVWSSLGTVIQPNAWTGTIVVRRVA